MSLIRPSRALYAPREPIRFWRLAVAAIALIGLGVALFLLFRESSDIRTLPLPPWAIFRWIDEHGELRNVPAFALLALPFLLLARGRRQRRRTAAALALFILVSEFGQLALHSRFFDLLDIASGWLGLALMWGLMEIVARLARHRWNSRRASLAGAPRPSSSGRTFFCQNNPVRSGAPIAEPRKRA